MRHRQPQIPELCDRVKNGRLTADTGHVDGGARVDIGATIEQQSCGFNAAELCGHVQQRRSLKQEAAAPRAAAVQFGKSPVRQRGIGIELGGQAIELLTEDFQDAWGVVPRRAAGSEEP